jgi:hypothetical protein
MRSIIVRDLVEMADGTNTAIGTERVWMRRLRYRAWKILDATDNRAATPRCRNMEPPRFVEQVNASKSPRYGTPRSD